MGGWNELSFKGPSNPEHSMIPWNWKTLLAVEADTIPADPLGLGWVWSSGTWKREGIPAGKSD